MPGPVAEERNIEEIISELKGIAYENWIRKWIRYINELLRIYGVEDPQEVLGIYDPTDPDEVRMFLEEHCSDLTESECYKKIEEMIRNYGYTRDMEELARNAEEELSRWSREASRVYVALSKFKLPVELPPHVADELLKIYENPSLDHDEVYKIVKNELLSLGWSEEEADKVAKESAKVIDEVTSKTKEARPITVAHWTQVLRYATRTTKKRLERRRRKAEDIVKRFIEATKPGETRILSSRELYLVGFTVKRAQSRTPQEAVSKLIREYHAAGAIIGSPATAFTFTDEPFLCRVKYLAKLNTWIVEKCEKPLLLVKVKPGKVYYQLIPGEE